MSAFRHSQASRSRKRSIVGAQTCTSYMISMPVEMFWMESRKSIIADLRRLEVHVNQILSYRPTSR